MELSYYSIPLNIIQETEAFSEPCQTSKTERFDLDKCISWIII